MLVYKRRVKVLFVSEIRKMKSSLPSDRELILHDRLVGSKVVEVTLNQDDRSTLVTGAGG